MMCSCGLPPAKYGSRCVYVTRLRTLAMRAAKHAGAVTGKATCPCHAGGDFDPHADCPRVRRAERLSVEAHEVGRAHYAATRWAS